MTVDEKAFQDVKKKWDELQKRTRCDIDNNGGGRRIWHTEKKRNYLRNIPDPDDYPAYLYAIYKALDKKSRLDPYLFFIGWIIYKYNKRAGEILSRLIEIDKGFKDIIGDEVGFKRIQGYFIKVIEAAIAVVKLKLMMLSEGWDIKVYQKAVAMGYQSAIKKEEKKYESFQRRVNKKQETDETISLRSIERLLHWKPLRDRKGLSEREIMVLNALRLARFLEEMVKRGFLDPETGICKGKKNQLYFRFSPPEKTCIKQETVLPLEPVTLS